MHCPLDLETGLVDHPRLHRRFPHELHWRNPPPEWHGAVDNAFSNLYPHLVDKFCCLNCGAVPCPYDHTAEKKMRLTDLEFIKDLAKERRELKEKLAKLLEEVRMYERLRRDWERERIVLEAEIQRLKHLNEHQQELLVNYKKDQQKILLLQQKIEALEEENRNLEEENKKFKKMVINQSNEIQKLTSHNRVLTSEVDKQCARVRTVTVQLDESKELEFKLKNQLFEKDAKLKLLQDSINQLIHEIEEKTQMFQEKDAKSQTLIERLREQINSIKQALLSEERTNGHLREQIRILLIEIEILQRRLAKDKRFHQFVKVKREVNQLKETNEDLLIKVIGHEQNCTSIPVVKRSGRTFKKSDVIPPGPRVVTLSPTSRRSSTGTKPIMEQLERSERPQSAAATLYRERSPSSMSTSQKLHRPKSAMRSLRAPEPEGDFNMNVHIKTIKTEDLDANVTTQMDTISEQSKDSY